jgi:hypothetical protein
MEPEEIACYPHVTLGWIHDAINALEERSGVPPWEPSSSPFLGYGDDNGF